MITDGGDCLSDLAVLRDQPELFGHLPHDVTVWRLLDAVAGDKFGTDTKRASRAFNHKQAWEQAATCPLTDSMLIIDICTTKTAPQRQTADTYKGHFGFHLLLCKRFRVFPRFDHRISPHGAPGGWGDARQPAAA